MLQGMFSWSLEKSSAWGRADLHLYVMLITAQPGYPLAGEAVLSSYTASAWENMMWVASKYRNTSASGAENCQKSQGD